MTEQTHIHMEKNDIESIVNHAKELKLGVIKDILDDILAEASEHQWSYSMFLNELLHREVEHRAENRKYQRIRKAGFPQMKYHSPGRPAGRCPEPAPGTRIHELHKGGA